MRRILCVDRHETRSRRTRRAAPHRCAGAHQGPRRGVESAKAASNRSRARARTTAGIARTSPAPRPDTVVTEERARSIISRNDSPDIHFEQSINPYRGCEHGCIYCYARPSHGYLNLSAGIDFETKLFAKTNAAELLRKELAKPGYVCSPINLGANTDPYQPIERRYRITRSILEVLAEHRHPCTIITKNALIERDLDLLVPMARANLVHAFVSVTSLDNRLAIDARAARERAAPAPADRRDA